MLNVSIKYSRYSDKYIFSIGDAAVKGSIEGLKLASFRMYLAYSVSSKKVGCVSVFGPVF